LEQVADLANNHVGRGLSVYRLSHHPFLDIVDIGDVVVDAGRDCVHVDRDRKLDDPGLAFDGARPARRRSLALNSRSDR
jgi:hypothetical protein